MTADKKQRVPGGSTRFIGMIADTGDTQTTLTQS